MTKLIHEVWEDPANDSYAMFVRGAKNWRATLSSQAKLIHTFEAESVFEAHQAHYDFMGWGKWSPPEGFSDERYDDSDRWPREARCGS